ncbi:MAG: ATP-binding protein [Proteobacteria bacterium]|nr:ATP-binding protein [Pseudomonadota bacterium]
MTDLCDLTGIGVWQLDLSTNSSLWSAQVYRLLQLDPDHLQQSGKFYAATVEEHFSLLQTRLTTAANLLQPSAWSTQSVHDLTVSGPAGDARQLRLRCLPAESENGTSSTIVCSLQDLANLPDVVETLPQLGKMALVGTMTSAAVHETRNMLGIVMGHLSAIDPAKAAADEATRIALEQSNAALARAAQLTDSLLSLARHQKPAPGAALAIDSVIQNLMPTIQLMLGANIAVELSLVTGDTPALIDKSIFECCLLNLVANSRDAMPQSGKLCISTLGNSPGVPDKPQPKDGFIEVLVRDSGIGMSAQTQQRCLEPFFTTKPEGKGTGLGLSLLNQLLTQTGGHLTIESKLGLGTTARLFMPIASADKQPSGSAAVVKAPALKPTDSKALRVLFVEDEPTLCKLAKRVLVKRGYSVTLASSAAEARQYLEQGRFELLISDVNLGGAEDGLSLTRFARSQQPAQRIVIISGLTEGLQTHCSEISAMYLPKPFSVDSLLQACKQD